MAESKLAPIGFNVPIVDPDTGYVTPYFQRLLGTWLEEKAAFEGDAISLESLGGDPDADRLIRWNDSSNEFEFITLSQAIDLVGSAAQGDILYRNGTIWTRLPAGTSGQFLKTLGTGANPAWAPITKSTLVHLATDTAGHTASTAINWTAQTYNDAWNPGDGGGTQRSWLGADFTFATTDVNTTNDTITETGHGLTTGEGPFFFTSSTTLPAGIAAATKYWAISVDANTISIATSRANALAGTKVNITSQGTGTHTCDRGSYLVVPKGATRAMLTGNCTDTGDLAGQLILRHRKNNAFFTGAGLQGVESAGSESCNITSCPVVVVEGDMFTMEDTGADAFTMLAFSTNLSIMYWTA